MKRLRCAIYTRKSSEEGLDQDFNSLDAQREACEAYIKSQAGEGWTAVKAHYDDGGISGGTLERPALQRLLNDIEAGRVNVVVVYKVDRLTRSLADFAKIVEVFDTRSVSFVSVTQQFNTTSSMGRLTLNMLLSFAQFEREVTGERIRDKIAASKRRGLWMGGVVPLGYDVEEKKLVVNAAEAETVRTLFRLYMDLGNVGRVQQAVHQLGLRTKARKPNNGTRQGGEPFTRGHIYKLLSNPIYLGEVVHKGERYPGEQAAIIDQEIWEAVQAQLQRNAVTRHHRCNTREPSLLAGLLIDGEGRPMKPAHANKSGRRYRYYISRLADDTLAGATPIWRLPAPALEDAVLKGICAFLSDDGRLIQALDPTGLAPDRVSAMLRTAARLGGRLRDAGPAEQRGLLLEVVNRVEVRQDRLRIAVATEAFRVQGASENGGDQDTAPDEIPLDIPVHFKRRGVELKLVLAGEQGPSANPDPKLIDAVIQAHRWFEDLRSGEVASVLDLAKGHGVDRGNVSKTLPLAFLAPDIVQDILDGRQPLELTTSRLKRIGELPASWSAQRQLLGRT